MTRSIVMLCYDDAQILDVAGPLEVFSRAARWLEKNRGLREAPYRVSAVSRSREISFSNGLVMHTDYLPETDEIDTLFITGGIGVEEARNDVELVEWLRATAPRARRIAGVCTGSLLLAAAGLLRGGQATTHWAYLDRLQQAEPECEIDRTSIFVRSGNLTTSAGVTAGMDMALALLEDDQGKSVALHVAQELVMFLRRPGDQAQFSRHFQAELRDTPFSVIERWVLEHLDQDLSIAALAKRMGMSERHFYRGFKSEFGSAPANWVRKLRVEEARRQLELGARSLKDVARRCGFGDEQKLRRAFRSELGITPTEYAERFS